MSIQKIMVIGAGQMGGGIAQVLAAIGKDIILNDIKQEFVDNRINFIQKILEKDEKKGKITGEQKEATLKRITPSTSMEDAKDCDLIIEAAVEKIEIKAEIFKKLDEITKPECILATNTSSIPITNIAAATKRADKVIGMHFMNPVPVMTLVEIIRGVATSNETYQAIEGLTKELGKYPVEVKDVPGFVSNRVLQVMINEAIYCFDEGVASVEGIDEVMKRGMNHPMGPLQLADFIGLDTVLSILEIMYKDYGNPRFAPCVLLKRYVTAGWLGKKSGKGFYDYE